MSKIKKEDSLFEKILKNKVILTLILSIVVF
jgi:hypothetical protein